MIDDRATTPDQLTYLARNIEWLAHRPEAPQAFDELATACRTVVAAIDTTPALTFLGLCDACSEPLYAQPTDTDVVCRPCARTYLATDRHQAMLDKANDHLDTAAQVSAYMTAHGENVKPELIRQWRKRKRLEPAGNDRDGRPLYRIGDVRELWAKGEQGKP